MHHHTRPKIISLFHYLFPTLQGSFLFKRLSSFNFELRSQVHLLLQQYQHPHLSSVSHQCLLTPSMGEDGVLQQREQRPNLQRQSPGEATTKEQRISPRRPNCESLKEFRSCTVVWERKWTQGRDEPRGLEVDRKARVDAERTLSWSLWARWAGWSDVGCSLPGNGSAGKSSRL